MAKGADTYLVLVVNKIVYHRQLFSFFSFLFFYTSIYSTQSITYAQVGVHINVGNMLRIAPLAQSTSRCGASAQLGGFCDLAQLDYRDPILVSTTDGVGTKVKIAHYMDQHDTIGIDLVAMSVNDLLVHGAEPLYSRLSDVLLEPTKMYVQSLLPLIKSQYIKALAHITGDGLLENIPRILPDTMAVLLDMDTWDIPPVFHWIAQLGNIDAYHMLHTFNMGIGMVAIVDPIHVEYVVHSLCNAGENVYVIGNVIHINSEKQQVIICNEKT